MAKQSPHGCIGGSSETGEAAGGPGRGRSRVPEPACGASRRGARPWTPGPSTRCTDCPGRSRGRTHSVFHVASLPPRQLGADSGRPSRRAGVLPAARGGPSGGRTAGSQGPSPTAQPQSRGTGPPARCVASGAAGAVPSAQLEIAPRTCLSPELGGPGGGESAAQRPERTEQMSSLLRLSRFFPGLYWELAFCCRWHLHASRR